MPDSTPTPSTPTPAAAPAPKPTVTDVTPAAPRVHQVVVPASLVATVVGSIDDTMPTGKTVRDIQVQVRPTGDLVFRISYNP